ncbi:MAG: sugar transporter periplasmic ligand binding protein [Conexibacter sp.]|nr:sugar transporter periplasmic ligand binding protein [Conexibacter sp.]
MASRRWTKVVAIGMVIALMAALAAGCGSSGASSTGGASGSSGSGSGGKDASPLANVTASSLEPSRKEVESYGPGTGLSADGQQPIVYTDPTKGLELTPALAARAKAAHLRIGVLMHTLQLDWSTLHMRGIKDTFARYDVKLIGPAVAEWDPKAQAGNIQDMLQQKPNAITGIPVDTSATGPAFKSIQQAGIPYVAIIQAPSGLKYGADYATQVANEPVREGATAAATLAKYIPKGGTVLCSCFGTPFWSVDERERGFQLYWPKNRPDVKVQKVEWLDAAKAGQVTADYLTAHPNVNGIYAAWDAPAMAVITAMRQQGKSLPVTTVDMGNAAAINLAQGGALRGASGQAAYDGGVGEALASIRAALGVKLAPYYITPPYPAVQNNVLKAYEKLWHQKPPAALVDACRSTPACAAGADNKPYLAG